MKFLPTGRDDVMRSDRIRIAKISVDWNEELNLT